MLLCHSCSLLFTGFALQCNINCFNTTDKLSVMVDEMLFLHKLASNSIKENNYTKMVKLQIRHTISSSKNGSTDHRAKSFYCFTHYVKLIGT
jgi:hypothetical protein